MVKTAAQKAARRQRRRKAVAAGLSAKGGKRRPTVVLEKIRVQPGGKRKRNRKRNGVGAQDKNVSDGISHSKTVRNNSSICDSFKLRREKVANISGTSAFTIAQALYLNPGNTTLFPVFSQIASTYEEFRVRHLSFEFVTEAYTAVSSTASAGKHIMVTQFDITDPAFTTDQQAEDYCGAISFRPYASSKYVVEAKKMDKRGYDPLKTYYVNYSANTAYPSSDSVGAAKFYNLGLFNFISSNNAVTTETGELYVTYAFDLIRPKQYTALSPGTVGAASHTAASVGSTGWGGIFATQTGSTFPISMGGGVCHITATIGTNYVLYTTINAATSCASGTLAVTAGGVALNNLQSDTTSTSPIPAVTGVATSGSISFVATSTICNVALTGCAIVGAATADVFVFAMPAALVTSTEPDRVTRLERMLEALTSRLKIEEDSESPYHEVKEAEKQVLKPISLPPLPLRRGWLSPSITT